MPRKLSHAAIYTSCDVLPARKARHERKSSDEYLTKSVGTLMPQAFLRSTQTRRNASLLELPVVMAAPLMQIPNLPLLMLWSTIPTQSGFAAHDCRAANIEL